MEARLFHRTLATFVLIGLAAFSTHSAAYGQFGGAGYPGSRQHVAHSQNFIVFAASPQWARQVAQVAEQHRAELAVYWLGKELPAWPERCPIHVQSGPTLGAGGETRFSLLPRGAGNWNMSVQGTPERILDSVLPHEITHTIFATHFAPLGKYVPRWADEGACTTVEHESEKSKHQHFLQQFLRTGRGLSFNRMFSLKEYPDDILPLYAQGHSAVQFLIDQGGARKFIKFVEAGMRTEQWEATLQSQYGYETIGQFQTLWNQWLRDGSPEDITAYAPGLASPAAPQLQLASSSGDAANPAGASSPESKIKFAIGTTDPAPVQLASNTHSQGQMAPATTERMSSGSWYNRRLREVTGNKAWSSEALRGDAEPLPENARTLVNHEPAAPQAPQLSPTPSPSQPAWQSTARPMEPQRVGVQVMDWGTSQPIPGMHHSTVPSSPTSQRPIQNNSNQPIPSTSNSSGMGGSQGQPIEMVPIRR